MSNSGSPLAPMLSGVTKNCDSSSVNSDKSGPLLLRLDIHD
jgi:hypothetical protein